MEHQRQQPAPRDGEPGAAGGAGSVVHQRPNDRAAQHGRPRLHARGRRHRVRRLPQEPGSDAPVLGQPARLQRPQRLPGGQPVHGRGGQPAARDDGRRLRVRRRQRRRAPTSRRWARCSRRSPTARRSVTGSRSPSRRSSASAPTRRLQRERRRVPPRRRARSRTASYNFAVLIKEFFASPLVTGAIATGTYRRRHRRADQHLAARPALRGAVQPARQARPVRAGGAGAQHDADGDRDDRAERGRRRVQPRLADPGHAVRSDAVLPRRPASCCARTSPRRSSTPRRAPASTRCSDVPRRDREHGREADGLSARPPGATPRRCRSCRSTTTARATSSSRRRRPARRRARRTRCARRSSWPANRQPPSGSAFKGRTANDETHTTRRSPRRPVRHRLHRAPGAGDRTARLVPAEPAPGDRPGSPVRDHRARPTCST